MLNEEVNPVANPTVSLELIVTAKSKMYFSLLIVFLKNILKIRFLIMIQN